MSPHSLKSLYPEIRPWERIRLLLAADERRDEVEYQRLFDASKLKVWYFSEHLLAEQALHVLALTYITEQLDAIASLFLALSQIALHPDEDHHWEQLGESSLYFFYINAQGWKAFCDKNQFPAETLVTSNHSGWMLSYCEKYLMDLVGTSEEWHKPAEHHVSAHDLEQRWQARLTEMTTSTPLETTP